MRKRVQWKMKRDGGRKALLRKVGKFFGQAEDYSGNRVIRKIKLEVWSKWVGTFQKSLHWKTVLSYSEHDARLWWRRRISK